MMNGTGVRPARFRRVQSRLYREVRRARFTRQPLTLLAVSAHPQDVKAAQQRLTEEAIQTLARNTMQNKLAMFLRDEIREFGTIACLDHHVVAVLPATAAKEADKVIRTLRVIAQQRLSLNLTIGSASLPDQEVTLVGLLQRAEDEMRGRWRRRASSNQPESERSPVLAGQGCETGREIQRQAK